MKNVEWRMKEQRKKLWSKQKQRPNTDSIDFGVSLFYIISSGMPIAYTFSLEFTIIILMVFFHFSSSYFFSSFRHSLEMLFSSELFFIDSLLLLLFISHFSRFSSLHVSFLFYTHAYIPRSRHLMRNRRKRNENGTHKKNRGKKTQAKWETTNKVKTKHLMARRYWWVYVALVDGGTFNHHIDTGIS